MADIEYFGGLPQAGIVPRAPHAGPLLRYVHEQEHGRRGFSGMVTVHPVGLPHGPKPPALQAFMDDARDILRPPGA